MPSGDSRNIRVNCVGANRQPFSLAEAIDIEWQLAKSVNGGAVLTKTLSEGDITIVQEGDKWLIDVAILPDDTETMKGDFYHECQVRFSDGAVLTPYAGTITITEDLIQ